MIVQGHNAEMLRCLRDCDVVGARKLWCFLAPHLHQPKDDNEVRATLHYARTVSDAMTTDARAYSHRWLLDHGLPSGLPDYMKPVAERLYPKIVDAVGIAVLTSNPEMKPLAKAIHGAMSYSVMESYADNVKDPMRVRQRMMEARTKVIDKLMGRSFKKFRGPK